MFPPNQMRSIGLVFTFPHNFSVRASVKGKKYKVRSEVKVRVRDISWVRK